MGHRVLQLLPLTESAAGENSPYSALSVFSIDPLYISVAGLAGVPAADLEHARAQIAGRRLVPEGRIASAEAASAGGGVRDTAARRATPRNIAPSSSFAAENRHWLHDYALFRALKDRFEWAGWEDWPAELKSARLRSDRGRAPRT